MRTKILILLIFIVVGCATSDEKVKTILDYIPDNTNYILKVNDLTSFTGELRNNSFLENSSFQLDNNIIQNLGFINTTKPFYLCNYNDKTTVLVDKEFTTFTFNDTLTIAKQSNLKEGTTQKFEYNSLEWNITTLKNTFVIHNYKEYEIPKQTIASNLKKLVALSNDKISASIFYNATYKNSLNTIFPEATYLTKNWFYFDIITKPKEIIFSGLVTGANKSIKDIGIGISQTANVTPRHYKKFTGYLLKDLSNSVFPKLSDSLLINAISEIGFIKNKSSTKALALFTSLPDDLLSHYASTEIESYKNIAIYSSDQQTELKAICNLFHEKFAPNYLALGDTYLIFSDSTEELHTLIDGILNNTTLADQEYFIKSIEKLPQQSSILSVNLNKKDRNQKSITILQATKNTSGYYVNVLNNEINTSLIDSKTDAITELATLELETELATDPILVKNYVTNGLDIVAQDVNHQLYLISLDGKIQWKRKLDSKIQGDIAQIDMYNNGKLQLAFTTKHNFYIVTRTGKDAPNFPVHFNDEISNATAIFDYDLKHDYRFLISQKDQLYMINNYAKSVSGFKLSKTLGNITATPQHIRVGRKDYILLKTDKNKLYILNRKGQIRIPVSKTFDFSKNKFYWYNNAFTTTTMSGDLIKITEKGKVTKQTAPLQKNHVMTATPKMLITFTENMLTVNNTTITLDYGIYAAPEIFKEHGSDYITITDTQNSKVYIYNTQTNPLEGTPVFGQGPAFIKYNNKTGYTYLVTKGGNHKLLLYKV
ncbi:hypothetical protein NBRC110019_30840 [Neptunitalea chrysea]|uniref:Uncharacterized protein n=1 Tax=Neptunitalea chrysea TaxID=1647581 RepID=A0A9W6B9L8_9FLAO|nr:hypothetical protein [Neptunitalea chrysea]GLB54043.1 hypothetical protein NBRC110019_30840 [Neptunitalea chrysea]